MSRLARSPQDHCNRIAAGAAAAAAVAGAFADRCNTTCRVFSLHSLVWFSLPFFPRFSSSASSASRWACPTPLSSRACSAAPLAARQTRRRPRAVRKCGPLFTRIHQAFVHHVMCRFDTSLYSCIGFISLFSSAHSPCVVISSFPSCPSSA